MNNERNYGLIRHVDELGRVVIPKEIRNQLNIHPEDAVEISVSGRSITIKKHQKLHTLESLCEKCLMVLGKSTNASCVICNTEHIVASRGVSISKEPLLSAQIRNMIRNQKIYHYSETETLTLFEDNKFVVDTLYPIGTSPSPMGAVILLHYRDTTQAEQACAKYLADLLTLLTQTA